MDYNKIGVAILSGGSALYKCSEEMKNTQTNVPLFVEFNWETACYILHMLDRSLSDLTSQERRYDIIQKLIITICENEVQNLSKFGYEVTSDEVDIGFRGMFNQRTLEYGKYKDNWFLKVAMEYGRNAADALELGEDIKMKVAMQISLLAPTMYKDLLPEFTGLFNDMNIGEIIV